MDALRFELALGHHPELLEKKHRGAVKVAGRVEPEGLLPVPCGVMHSQSINDQAAAEAGRRHPIVEGFTGDLEAV